MPVTFAVESLRDVWPEMELLFPLHFEETGRREGAMDVDRDRFFAMEDAGAAQAVIARADEGEKAGRLVGYFVGFIFPNLHNRSLMTAVSDMYFLHPAYRGHAGVRMFREVEKAWKAAGVQAGAMTCKVNRNYGRLFERLGWQLEEQLFIKKL